MREHEPIQTPQYLVGLRLTHGIAQDQVVDRQQAVAVQAQAAVPHVQAQQAARCSTILAEHFLVIIVNTTVVTEV